MATTTYEWPIAGVTAPTATQMFGHNTLVAQVAPALYDTTIVITHNMNISTADLASGFPEIEITPIAAAFATSTPFISARAANSVTVTISDPVTEAEDTFRITIKRPQSKEK